MLSVNWGAHSPGNEQGEEEVVHVGMCTGVQVCARCDVGCGCACMEDRECEQVGEGCVSGCGATAICVWRMCVGWVWGEGCVGEGCVLDGCGVRGVWVRGVCG